MRYALCIIITVAALLTAHAPAMADPIWCSSFTDPMFCFDFDRACYGAPAYPEACPAGGTRSDGAIRNVWNYTSWNYNTMHACGSNMCGEEILSILPTDPYGGRHANGGDEGGTLGQNTIDLTSYIQSALPGSIYVNGSNAEPLVLTFTMGAYARGAMQYNNGYMELSLGNPAQYSGVNDPAKAPTDYVLVGGDNGSGCLICDNSCATGDSIETNSWPTICQQEFPHPLCPTKQTFVRNAIAIGALALLDNNPCHCGTQTTPENDPYYSSDPWRRRVIPEERTTDLPDGWQEPTNVHLSYYDGLEWHVLREGVGGPGGYGDFRYGNYIVYGPNKNADEGFETVEITVKTNTVDIYHKTIMPEFIGDQWVPTVVESMAYDLPRHYTGNFNRLRAGTDESCRLNYDSYSCDPNWKNGKKLCKVMKEERCEGGNATYRSSYVAFDNVRLTGGTPPPPPTGACCLTNGTCVDDVTLDTCETTMGGTFLGYESTCAESICCPTPFADADGDGDVDQNDFADFQVCFSGSGNAHSSGCECYDRLDSLGIQGGDGDVDGNDFVWFENCVSGPSIMLDPQNLPAGCIP